MLAPIAILALVLLTGPAPTGWWVVLRNGQALHVALKPETRGELLIVRLEGGATGSLHADEVERVVEAPAEARDAPSSPVRRRRGQVRRLDNAALSAFTLAHPASTVPTTGATSNVVSLEVDTPPPAMAAEPEPERRDRNGRGRDYWASLARDAREAVRRARNELDAIRRHASELEHSVLYGVEIGEAVPGPGGTFFVNSAYSQTAMLVMLQDARAAQALAESRLKDAEEYEAILAEDARRAGALPGWLRP